MRKIVLVIGGLAVILAGVVSFAAFESHIVNVRAHVESATYTTPGDINLGTVFPQERVRLWCMDHDEDLLAGEVLGGIAKFPCAQIGLSESFLNQDPVRVKDVEYKIYCEPKEPGLQNITPFMKIWDSDPGDMNDRWWRTNPDVFTLNCYPPKAGEEYKAWAAGKLDLRSGDEVDLWDFTFYAPVCEGTYNPGTDPNGPPPPGIPQVVDCGEDEELDMGSDIKFQVTGFSYGCICPRADLECTCEE